MKRLLVLISLLCLTNLSWANKQKLGESIKEQIKSDAIAIEGQKKVNVLDDKTQELLREYRLTLRKIESTKLYNEQMVKLIQSQLEEKKSLSKQIDEIKVTNQEIVPLMITMLQTFDSFIQADSPFLPEERQKRAKDLKAMMDRADVSTSEKYRRIMEAYQIENDYGKTLEAYRGVLNKKDQELTVDFLRIGRVAVYYQTLDTADAGIWDNQQKTWVSLGSGYKKPLREAIKIARKQTAPNLMILPLIKKESSL
jgi:hypothetical protein